MFCEQQILGVVGRNDDVELDSSRWAALPHDLVNPTHTKVGRSATDAYPNRPTVPIATASKRSASRS